MKPQHWIIYGNDVCSWSAALFLHQRIPAQHLKITILCPTTEPEPARGLHLNHETVRFHQDIDIDEADFLCKTKASISLATEFSHWSGVDQRLLFSGTAYGQMLNHVDFFHWLQRIRSPNNQSTQPLSQAFNLNTCSAGLNRYAPVPFNAPPIFHNLEYGFQVNENRYCTYLETLARTRDITVIDLDAFEVSLPAPGEKSIHFKACNAAEANLSFDFLLTTRAPSKPSSHWQDCSETIPIATQQHSSRPTSQYSLRTQMTKTSTGWNCTLTTQDESLTTNYQQHTQQDGIRVGFELIPWQLNQLYLGDRLCQLGSCFSNSLGLTQRALNHLFELFPYQLTADKALEFNRLAAQDCGRLLDLHNFIYWSAGVVKRKTQSLTKRLELFSTLGFCRQSEQEFISDSSWQVLIAELHQWPKDIPRKAFSLSHDDLNKQMSLLAHNIGQAANTIPPFKDLIDYLAKAKPV